MATFGENLRRERELRGITLPELANATRVHPRYLEALEKDRFDLLPGGVFNRGFVRSVARYMKLDEHFWVGEYVRAAKEKPEILARYAPPQAGPPANSRRPAWSLALLLVVFAGGAYLVHELRLRQAAEASPRAASAPAAVSSAARSPEPPVTLQPASIQTPAPTPAATGPVPRGRGQVAELRLQIDALEDAWVAVSADDRPLYQGLMKPGESRSFRGRQRIEVTTGNASAIVLTLNGETLAPLGNPGERKNVLLTAKDLQPSLP